MQKTPHTLYPLQKKDVSRAGALLMDAFQEDPVWKAILVHATSAQKAAAFETPIHYCLKYGEVYAPSPALEGVAAWLPAALSEMTPWRMLRSGALWSGIKMGAEFAGKLAPIFKQVEADRKAITRDQPFLYLQIVGVAPACQGQGFGGQLISAFIEKGRQAGVSLYLETETESNQRMYEHFGFTVVKEIILPEVNLPMWELVMLR